MKSKIIYLFVIFLVGAIGCQKCEEKVDTEAAIAAIEAAAREWVAAVNRKDAKGVAAIYTTEARILAPNRNIIRGRKAIEGFMQEYIDMGMEDVELETVEIEVREDIVVRIGEYKETIQPAGGEAVTDRGKFVEVWRPEDGSWKIDVDIFNTSLPAAGQ